MELAPDEVTVEVAFTAVGANAAPRSSLTLTDSNCAAPTAGVPTCGQFLLPNGASGHVTLSVGSCDGLGPCRTGALVVTAIANLKDAQGTRFTATTHPCHPRRRLRQGSLWETANGVPSIPLIYTLDNDGPLKTEPPPPGQRCARLDQEACVDYVSSSRSQGDLYLHLLYKVDARASFP